MRTLGIIPARYGSSRFPGKPLIDLKGKTMIERVYEGAAKSDKIEMLVVATDDQRIYDEVKRFGGNVLMTSAEHQTGTDRCAEVARHFPNNDIIINIQGDEPLVDVRQLDQLITAFENPETEIATLGIAAQSMDELMNPNRIKVVVNAKDQALYFSRSCIPNFEMFKSDALDFYPFLRHIGLYAYRSDILQQITELPVTALEKVESLEQLRWLYHRFQISVVRTEIETPNIDVPEDIDNVIAML